MSHTHPGFITLGSLEGARRERRYEQMDEITDSIMRTLVDLDEREANELLSRVLYELHMAKSQQADAATDEKARNTLFSQSRQLNRESRDAAAAAGDFAGVLNADMNNTGPLAIALDIPAGTPWRDVLKASVAVSDEAEAFTANPTTSEKDRRRALRVAVNCYFHQWRILRDNGGDRSEVAALLDLLLENPVYADPLDSSYRDAVSKEVEEIRRYLVQ